MKTYFVYTSKSGEEHRIDVEDKMKELGDKDMEATKEFLMGYIGKNKHFEYV